MIGIDEVGRGAWAGPLLVAAVQLPEVAPESLSGVADSKKLTKQQRQAIAKEIELHALFVGMGWVSAIEIDDHGLSAAMKLACSRALNGAPGGVDIVVDGHIDYVNNGRSRCEIKADATVPAVSAASIIAKVARDAHMAQLAEQYPLFGFEQHVGYGTQRHITALQTHGFTPQHRMSYKPIRKILDTYEA